MFIYALFHAHCSSLGFFYGGGFFFYSVFRFHLIVFYVYVCSCMRGRLGACAGVRVCVYVYILYVFVYMYYVVYICVHICVYIYTISFFLNIKSKIIC